MKLIYYKLGAKSLVINLMLCISLFILSACGSGGNGGEGGGTGSIAFTAGISNSLVAGGGQLAAACVSRSPSHAVTIEIPSKQIHEAPISLQQSYGTLESMISQKLLRYAWLFAPSTAYAKSISKLEIADAMKNPQLLAQVADDEIDCDLYEIDDIKAYVLNATGRVIAKGGPWPCSQHGGTIVGVPVGESLKLEIIATEICSHENIYQGEGEMDSAGNPITVLPGRTTQVGKIMMDPVHNPWGIFTVDILWCEGIYDAVNTSIAVSPKDDSLHISYYDCGYDGVKYATNNSGLWILQTVDEYGEGYSSIDVDSYSYAHVGYIRYGEGREIFYATNSTGSWDRSAIDSGSYGSVVEGLTSIALDSSENAHISGIIDTDYDYIVIWTPSDQDGDWTSEFGSLGTYASFDIDSTDIIHISYYDEENGNLLYATNGNASGGAWLSTDVDSEGDVGAYPSIAVNHDDGSVHIVYYDYTNGDLKYAMNDNPTSPDSPWQIDRVDEANDVGLYPSIALDSSGYPHISYYDWENGDLKYAAGTSGCWVTHSVDTSGDVGLYTSIAIDSKDNVHISYIVQSEVTAPNGALKYATKKILR